MDQTLRIKAFRDAIGRALCRVGLPGIAGWWDAGTDQDYSRRQRRAERAARPLDPEVVLDFDTFWRDIVMPDGKLDFDQIRRELHDYHDLLVEVPKVYDHITGGRISKPNTLASSVIGVHDDICTNGVDDRYLLDEGQVDDLHEAVRLLSDLSYPQHVMTLIDERNQGLDALEALRRVLEGTDVTVTRVALTEAIHDAIRILAELDGAQAAVTILRDAVGLGETGMPGSGGAALIAAERRRQVVVEGHTAAHDFNHDGGELAIVAWCYLTDHVDMRRLALTAAQRVRHRETPPREWPWAQEDWKPTPGDPLRQLVKVGALVAAEIDRLEGCPDADQV